MPQSTHPATRPDESLMIVSYILPMYTGSTSGIEQPCIYTKVLELLIEVFLNQNVKMQLSTFSIQSTSRTLSCGHQDCCIILIVQLGG